ncbi:PAS domain-containing protein [Microvirga sp. 0TCS3.31]
MKTINFEALFSASPNPYVLLDLSLTIVGMNNAYLKVTMREREDLIGRNMFEAFPSDPDSPSHRQLRHSFEKVIREKVADHLPLIEYAIPLPNGQGFEERFWSATHTPLFNHAGEMTFILQHTVDVTELQRLRVLARSSGLSSGPSALIETDMFRRAQAVQEANQALTEERQHLCGASSSRLPASWPPSAAPTIFSQWPMPPICVWSAARTLLGRPFVRLCPKSWTKAS